MIALEINQNRIVGQAYRVCAFFAPPVIGEAIDTTNFRTLEGPAGKRPQAHPRRDFLDLSNGSSTA